MLDILLHSSQHVWLESPIKFVDLFVVGEVSEFSFKHFGRGELLRVDVIEEGPELLSVVLDGGASEKQNSLAG